MTGTKPTELRQQYSTPIQSRVMAVYVVCLYESVSEKDKGGSYERY